MAKQYGYQNLDETPCHTGQQRRNYMACAPQVVGTVQGPQTADEVTSRNKNDEETEHDSDTVTIKAVLELLVCTLSFACTGLCLTSIGPTLFDLREITSLSISDSSAIFISQSVGFFFGCLLAKKIFEKLAAEFVLSGSLFAQAIFSSLVPTFRSAAVMCLMFAGQGFTLGLQGVGVCAICIHVGGKKRNSMFLQTVHLGAAIGSALGPLAARPFLSSAAKKHDHYIDQHTTTLAPQRQTTLRLMSDNTSAVGLSEQEMTNTNVQMYYIIMGVLAATVAMLFLIIFLRSGNSVKAEQTTSNKVDSLSLKRCTLPLAVTIMLVFLECILSYGIQDAYSNLLTTFAVLGPLNMNKSLGVYLSSVLWASVCIGRLNGIWVAKLLSPIHMLLINTMCGICSSLCLSILVTKSETVLWIFTGVLGLSLSTTNGAVVSWAAKHLPSDSYAVLTIVILGRCVGLLVVPSAVTVLFKAIGPMTVMYSTLLSLSTMMLAVLITHYIVVKFGADGRLYTRQRMRNEPQGHETN